LAVLTDEELGGVAGGGLWEYLFGGSGSGSSASGIDFNWDGNPPDASYATNPRQNPSWWSPSRGWNSNADDNGLEQGGFWLT
jgi:hypothetical protein